MANKFLSVLGKIGLGAVKAVPEVIAAAYPPLSGLMGVVSSLTLKAQAEIGPGQNETKKAKVLDDLALFEPFIIPLIEQIAGKDLDDEAFAKLISDIVDINVQWHKLIGTIPTPNVAGAVPVPPAPVIPLAPKIVPVAGQ